MENKHVGFLIIGIAILLVAIIFLFQSALTQIVSSSCSMEVTACPMYSTITQQTYLALAIVGILVIIGLILVFAKPKEKIIIKTIREKKKKLNLDGLDKDERAIVDMLLKDNGAMFQSTLMEKLNIGKVGVTRLLDKLEAKQIIERKRRGMNNIVVLKD
jgi:predicted transcriptional regulator